MNVKQPKWSIFFSFLLFPLLALSVEQWRSDTTQSSLTFTGSQAGAAFRGTFERFTPEVWFDPLDLPKSKFDIAIDLQSASTNDKERDDVMKGPDFLSADQWPTARYKADSFVSSTGGKFIARGRLTLRNVTRDVPVTFTFVTDATGAWLKGEGAIKRLDFGIGQGDWKDTTWVGNDIKINFSVRLVNQARQR